MVNTMETKSQNPIVALCYDFDKTLTPDNMQAQGYLEAIDFANQNDFWAKSNKLADENEMDRDLAWMYTMLREARGKLIFSRNKLTEYGSSIALYPGVESWFERITNYGLEQGITIEHYIISSGIKEMIEGTKPATLGAFKRIYASAFYYDEDGVAVWPAQVINYTNKTQFLFRISKGVLDVNDSQVNQYYEPMEIRIPFRNMIYIGDSETDIPCMKLVTVNGGHAIGVYNPDSDLEDPRAKVHQLMRDRRISYYAPANYEAGSELEILVKEIIESCAKRQILEEKHYQYLQESKNFI